MAAISAVSLMMWSAQALRSSEAGRKPHVTPADSTQARRAVSMSTAESPTINTSCFGVGHSFKIANSIDGSGFRGYPGCSPLTAANSMSPK